VEEPTCTVRYTAHVYVTIKGRDITRVVVDDENLELDEPVPTDVLEILETREWAPWDFGF